MHSVHDGCYRLTLDQYPYLAVDLDRVVDLLPLLSHRVRAVLGNDLIGVEDIVVQRREERQNDGRFESLLGKHRARMSFDAVREDTQLFFYPAHRFPREKP